MCNPDVTAMPIRNRYAAFNVIACSLLFTFVMFTFAFHSKLSELQIDIAVTNRHSGHILVAHRSN